MIKPRPLFRDGTKSAGDDLHVNATGVEFGQQLCDFAVANHGIAADDGEMQRTIFVHQGEHALHQVVAALVMKLPQVHTAYMPFSIGIATGTAQRTLSSDLNSERWPSAAQDALPGLNDFFSPHNSF